MDLKSKQDRLMLNIRMALAAGKRESPALGSTLMRLNRGGSQQGAASLKK
jgi:hypothetical protein